MSTDDLRWVCAGIAVGMLCLGELPAREIPTVTSPPYLFHVSNRSGDCGGCTGSLMEMPNDVLFAREYVQTVYPESFMDLTAPVDFTVNGHRAWNVHPCVKIARDRTVEDVPMTFELSAPGYAAKRVDVPLKMVNVGKLVSHGVRLMVIGDSTSASKWGNELNRYEDGGWGLVSCVQELAVKDAVDFGEPCRFMTVGTETRDGCEGMVCTVDYRGGRRRIRSFSEARSGTGLFWMTLYPDSVQPKTLTYDIGRENVRAIQGAAIWDFLGLGTRRSMDGSGAGRAYVPCPVDAEGLPDAAALDEIRHTPFGRYRWDVTERLWNNVANILKRRDAWSGSAEQRAATDGFCRALMDRPKNPFYDAETAKRGAWAFSLAKYLERRRTLTDGGERLYFGPNGETKGVGGGEGWLADGTRAGCRIGTEVTDVMAADVCLPTHVALEYGFNDWCFYDWEKVSTEMLADHQELARRMIAAFAAANPTVRIGLFASRNAGAVFPANWNDVAITRQDRVLGQLPLVRYRQGLTEWYRREYADLSGLASYIPVDVVVPVTTSWSAARLETPSGAFVNVLYDGDRVHDGLRSQRCKALQVYGWTLYTLGLSIEGRGR